MTNPNIELAVQAAVCEALALEPDEVTPEATLTDELGAESIDLLDVLFRIGRSTRVKIEAEALADYIQGGIPEDEFSDESDVVTPRALAHLATIMPQIDSSALDGHLKAERVIDLFTVGNLANLVAHRATLVEA